MNFRYGIYYTTIDIKSKFKTEKILKSRLDQKKYLLVSILS